jgi:hypothetical protein
MKIESEKSNFTLQQIIIYHTVAKFCRLRLVGHVTLIEGIRNACKVLFVKLDGKTLERS